MNVDEFITGEKFSLLANGDDVLYCHTHDVKNLLTKLPSKKIVLITHNSDGNITNNPIKKSDISVKQIPDNIKMWYAQNVNVEHPRLCSIPLGLENLKWFGLKKQNQMLSLLKTPSQKRNLLFVGHNTTTNRKEREEPYKLFGNKNWTTAIHCKNWSGFKEYINNIYSHKFVLCPEGNGIDTVRLWECLYMNTIPIVKTSINTSFYSNLPILCVNKWNDISRKMLEEKYNYFINTEHNREKIMFSYWKKRILEGK